jgi:hypothetical protein
MPAYQLISSRPVKQEHSLLIAHIESGLSTFVDRIFYISDCDGQRGALHIEHSILALSIASGRPAASLPQKLGYTEATNVYKLLKTWSGRRDSNPRRPAWEYERRL